MSGSLSSRSSGLPFDERIRNFFSFIEAQKPGDECYFDPEFVAEIKAAALRGASVTSETASITEAAIRFAKAHIACDEFDGRDEGDEGDVVTQDEYEAMTKEYNESKAALVNAYRHTKAGE